MGHWTNTPRRPSPNPLAPPPTRPSPLPPSILEPPPSYRVTRRCPPWPGTAGPPLAWAWPPRLAYQSLPPPPPACPPAPPWGSLPPRCSRPPSRRWRGQTCPRRRSRGRHGAAEAEPPGEPRAARASRHWDGSASNGGGLGAAAAEEPRGVKVLLVHLLSPWRHSWRRRPPAASSPRLSAAAPKALVVSGAAGATVGGGGGLEEVSLCL